MSDHDPLLNLATLTQGQLYAGLLRADIEINKLRRAGQPVPQSWLDKRRRIARELDAERARFARELERSKREFWRS